MYIYIYIHAKVLDIDIDGMVGLLHVQLASFLMFGSVSITHG
jgi:hypothetical protein